MAQDKVAEKVGDDFAKAVGNLQENDRTFNKLNYAKEPFKTPPAAPLVDKPLASPKNVDNSGLTKEKF